MNIFSYDMLYISISTIDFWNFQIHIHYRVRKTKTLTRWKSKFFFQYWTFFFGSDFWHLHFYNQSQTCEKNVDDKTFSMSFFYRFNFSEELPPQGTCVSLWFVEEGPPTFFWSTWAECSQVCLWLRRIILRFQ